MKRVIHWFRRDLRLHDNTALAEASRRAEEVVPVFVLEDAFRTGPDVGAARLLFLLRSVAELRHALAGLGYSLIVRHGQSEEQIPLLARELKAEAVFANIRYEPYAQRRDARVFNALNAIGVGFELLKDAVIWHEQDILTQAGRPFTVFTPYSKAWKARKTPPPRPSLERNRVKNPTTAPDDALPTDPAALGHPCTQTIMEGGEAAALKRVEEFFSSRSRGRQATPVSLPKKHSAWTDVHAYAESRNRVDVEGTSQLSAHLRAGTIGIRTLLARLDQARKTSARTSQGQNNCEVFLNELIWREFYLQVLHNFPHVMRAAFRPEYNALQWSDNEQHFKAWCEGQTGYPIVDAAMRCLNATGWMHNRLRMIVAMFLTKDLLINWQWGERYFMKQLVDGDMAANNGGWQWSAGTGTDAAPYFRIFNPITQAEKCDPNGEFVRRWIPELDGFDGASIHRPWEAPVMAARYTQRIVLHEEQRAKALAMFERVKKKGAP